MRDPKRIEPFLQELARIWRANPDLRFGQLVLDLHALSGAGAMLFYTEDEELLNFMKEC